MGQGSWGKVIETQFTGSFHDKKKQDRRSKLSKQRRRPRPVVPVTPKQMRDAYLRRKHIAHKNHAVFGEDRREPVKVLHIDPRLPPPPPHPEPHHPKQSRIVSIQEPHKPQFLSFVRLVGNFPSPGATAIRCCLGSSSPLGSCVITSALGLAFVIIVDPPMLS